MNLKILLLLACAAHPLKAELTWPQFRGPTGDGHAAKANLPTSFDEQTGVVWKAPVAGKGWSSPVVGDSKIWITTAIEEQPSAEEEAALIAKLSPKEQKSRQVVKSIILRALAFDLATGEQLHAVDLLTVPDPVAIHTLNSYASPTPVLESGRLYCHFGSFGTVALDTETLQPLWQRTFQIEHSVGPGSSPFVADDLVILICDGVDQQYVVAVHKDTGETVWKTPRPEMRAASGDQKKAYNTPILIEVNGRQQLICMGSQWLISYHPKTGQEIWKSDHGSGFSVVPRPVFGHGHVYVSTGFGNPELLAISVDGEGDVTDTHLGWKQTKRIPARPSPLLVGQEIYVVSDGGIASCFDANTGEEHWVERIGGNHSASPIYANGLIYFFSHEGEVTVLRASPSYELVETNIFPSDEGFMASPAVAQDSLILRSKGHLYRIGNK